MTGLEDAVITVSSVAGSAVAVGAAGRGWLRGMVQGIVDKSVTDLIRRQAEAEHRQGQHLDRQDKRLARIEAKLNQRLPVPGEEPTSRTAFTIFPAGLPPLCRAQPESSTSGSTGGPGGTSYQGSLSGVARL